MKKFLAIVLALVMVASLGVCAFADYPDKAINLHRPDCKSNRQRHV